MTIDENNVNNILVYQIKQFIKHNYVTLSCIVYPGIKVWFQIFYLFVCFVFFL